MDEPVIYQLGEKEVHMMRGEDSTIKGSIGVVWNCKDEVKTLKGEDGLEYKATVPVRDGKPYIDCLSITKWDDGEYLEDEDSPIRGGITPIFAAVLIEELQWAIDYIQQFLK